MIIRVVSSEFLLEAYSDVIKDLLLGTLGEPCNPMKEKYYGMI